MITHHRNHKTTYQLATCLRSSFQLLMISCCCCCCWYCCLCLNVNSIGLVSARDRSPYTPHSGHCRQLIPTPIQTISHIHRSSDVSEFLHNVQLVDFVYNDELAYGPTSLSIHCFIMITVFKNDCANFAVSTDLNIFHHSVLIS